MKPFLIGCAILLLACGGRSDDKLQSENDALRQKADSLQRVTDSLKAVSDKYFKTADSLRRPEASTDDTLAKDAAKAGGKNPITLHWISWDKPGEATLDPLPDGSYQISGAQANENREYLNIMGVIKRISDREIEFDGTVETRVNTNNGGKPCIKTGKQLFLRTGTRKYYRMQNMENCEGGRPVDYIDIYPGTSGLF